MTLLDDAAARARALNPVTSFIVQAPAGSGKTELLTQRFLALLATVRRPDEILAITFTRKAASEMRHRLLQALKRGGEEAVPEKAHERLTWELARAVLRQDRECGWDLLDNPGLLGIQTIDSFNASLVRRMPWVSRLGGVPAVAENPARLYREAARRVLSRTGMPLPGGAEAAQLLGHLDNRMELLESMLIAMLQRRDQWLRHLAGADHAAQRDLLESALEDYIAGTLQQARSLFPPGFWATFLPVGRYAASNLPENRPASVLTGLQEIPGCRGDDLSLWQGMADLLLTGGGELRRRLDKNCGFPPGGGAAATMKESMLALLAEPSLSALAPWMREIRSLPPAFYADRQWQTLQALVDLLLLAARELWLVFREAGEVDFAEIAGKALAALREDESPSDLLLRLDNRLSHLLVDEFQDTSWLQFELLERLTEGWQEGDGRTLFLVGDPMQSIYRFREAEVGLFLRAQRQGIGSVRLEPLQLSANFRSRAGVVEWVNASFSAIFPSSEDLARGAVRYARATPVHAAEEGPAVRVHCRLGRDDSAEAEAVVSLVREALNLGEGSIAILVRSRTHLAQILPALRQAGLRYLAQEIDLLAERPVARDIVSLTRSLLHPGDRLAWLATLRAPWCGLTLSDLHLLCRDHRQAPVPQLLSDAALLDLLSDDGRLRASRTFSVLRHGMQERGRVDLRRLVEACWLALGGPACCTQSEMEDAERVFDLLERLSKGGDLLPVERLEEELQKLFAAPDTEADGRLQVMTMHKAKGLEFDTVILPGLGRSPRQGEKPLLRWLEHPECGLLLAPVEPRGEGDKDPIYETIGRLEKEKGELEATRLLYVAATRARHRLHLLGHVEPRRNNDPAPGYGSLFEKLWPALDEERSPTATFGGDEPADPPSLQLRRLPADWRPPILTPGPTHLLRKEVSPTSDDERRGEERIFTGREAETLRHVGTVVHHWLERFGREGIEGWSAERLGEIGHAVRRQLLSLGVPSGELDDGMQRVSGALRTTLESRRGRWLLSPHREAAVEYPVSGIVAGDLVHAVIDRTFIDERGARWIVDYKTSLPAAKESVSAFYARERERYQGQLHRYAALLASLDPHCPVRAALYFPLIDGWCELPLAAAE